MSKNGPLALLFNALVITFMLAPLVIVCVVAFTLVFLRRMRLFEVVKLGEAV